MWIPAVLRSNAFFGAPLFPQIAVCGNLNPISNGFPTTLTVPGCGTDGSPLGEKSLALFEMETRRFRVTHRAVVRDSVWPLNSPSVAALSDPIKPDLPGIMCSGCVPNARQAKIREAEPVSEELRLTDAP